MIPRPIGDFGGGRAFDAGKEKARGVEAVARAKTMYETFGRGAVS